MSCGGGRRWGSDAELLWLWCRPVATAPIGPLAWEPPYAAGVALKKKKKERKKEKDGHSRRTHIILSIGISCYSLSKYEALDKSKFVVYM